MKQLKFPCMGLMAFFMLFVPLFGQNTTTPEHLTQDLPNIPYIFEGEIISVTVYLGDKDGNRLPWGVDQLPDGSKAISYSSAIIQVCKIYKGATELQNGTVEIVTPSMWKAYYDTDPTDNTQKLNYFISSEASHGQQFSLSPRQVGGKFIFFARQSTNVCTTGSQSTNPYKIDLYKDDYLIAYNKAWFDMMALNKTKGYPIDPLAKDGYAYGFNQYYANDTEIAQFMGSLGLNPDTPNSCTNWNDQLDAMQREPMEDATGDIDYSIRKENYDKFIQIKSSLIDNNKPKDIQASGLILEMANERLSGTPSEYYLEFDIMISATDNTTYLDNCLMHIQYNAGAFGTNIATNNNIIVTRDPAFNSATYIEPNFNLSDDSPNIVAIPMGSDFAVGSWNRTAITIFPIKMLTVRMVIQNCNQLSDVFFAHQDDVGVFSFYTVNANDDFFDGIQYDNTTYMGTINDPMCQPIITNFTDNVPAGINEIVTIKGKYFGTSKFSGNVIFKDADNGNVYPPPTANNSGGVDGYDILGWSDDEIQVRLPGRIDSIQFAANDPFYQAVPGSGYFKVKNYTQTYGESSSPITIPFSIIPAIPLFPYAKRPIAITGPDAGGYVMHCTPDVEATYPGAKAAIRKAMRDWSCASGINITLGADMAGTPGDDGIGLITLSSSLGAVMFTDVNEEICNTGVPNFYLINSDILISTDYTWDTDTVGNILASEVDFYEAIAHEIGHAHLLDHINDSLGNIMFYMAAAVFVPENLRKKVWSSYSAMAGSNYVTANLILNVTTCLPLHVMYHPSDCTGISIEEVGENNHYVSIWPNPTGSHGTVTVAFDLQTATTTQFYLYNSLGQLIRLTEAEFTAGKVTYSLPVADLAAGNYYITVRIGDLNYTVQFIKTL